MYVSVEGLSNIFKYSEYNELSKVQSIIEHLEDKDKIVSILNSSDNFLDIKVGDENNEQPLVENTIIKSSYFFNKNNIGVIAIVAPMRMNYELSIEAMFKLSRRINGLIIRGIIMKDNEENMKTSHSSDNTLNDDYDLGIKDTNQNDNDSIEEEINVDKDEVVNTEIEDLKDSLKKITSRFYKL